VPAIPRLSRRGGRWLTALLFVVLSGLLVLSGHASARSDPLLSQQWHLLDRDHERAGANVISVWPATAGAGIVIGIVDDGVQGQMVARP